jgi:general secretion pathway protein G
MKHRAQRGFTIIELLVVMAVLGILGAALLPLSETLVTAQKERALKQALWELRDAIDRYKAYGDEGLIAPPKRANAASGYPPNLQTLVAGSPQSEGSARHFFLRRIPRDPFAAPELPAEQTWGLRSYASPPDKPLAGADVYDVYSLSTAKALDGSYYKDW